MDGDARGAGLQRLACYAAGLTGLWSLGCWWLGHPELAGLVPGALPVLPGAGLWMLLVASALWLGHKPPQGPGATLASVLSLALVVLLLVMAVAGWHGPWPPPNPMTGLALILVSLALVLRDQRRWPQLDLSGTLALVALVAPYFALLGYAVQVTALYRPDTGSGMALATALVLVLTSLATLASRPDGRWMAWWRQDTLGGALLRRQVPMILVAPSVLGMLAIAGEHADLYPHEVAVGLILVISGLTGAAHTLWMAHSLDRLEAARMVAIRDLQASESMFRGLMETASDAILIVDDQQRITFMNRQVAPLFGYEPGELMGASVDQLIPPRSRSSHAGQVAGFMASPRHRRLDGTSDLYSLRKDGTEFPVEVSLSPLETVEGSFVMVLVRDLTERRRAAEAIARLNEELQRRNEAIEAEIARRTQELAQQSDLVQQAINHVPAGFAMVDPDLGLRWANAEYARQLGIPLETLLERKAPEVLPLDVARIDHAALRSGHPILLTGAPLSRENGTTYWDASLMPMFDDGAYQGFLVMANEVTARLELERLQQDHIAALERADALKDEFLNIVSHELRTPIAVLSGALSLFEYEVDGPLSPNQRRDLVRMRESTDQLRTLVNDLLDMSMIQAGKLAIVPRPLAVGDLIDGAIDIVQPLATERRIALQTQVAAALPVVMADGQRIRQILINLVTNALKYAPEESTVEIRVRPDDAGLRCEVADQGPGVPPADRERIFEKFTRLSSEATQEGAGLGLYICRALIDMHQGAIGVESDGNTGSTFWFTLPEAR